MAKLSSTCNASAYAEFCLAAPIPIHPYAIYTHQTIPLYDVHKGVVGSRLEDYTLFVELVKI